jgi:hypothetical protein
MPDYGASVLRDIEGVNNESRSGDDVRCSHISIFLPVSEHPPIAVPKFGVGQGQGWIWLA